MFRRVLFDWTVRRNLINTSLEGTAFRGMVTRRDKKIGAVTCFTGCNFIVEKYGLLPTNSISPLLLAFNDGKINNYAFFLKVY